MGRRTADGTAVLPANHERKAARVRRAVRDRTINSMLLAGATEDEIAEALNIRRTTVVNTIRRQLVRWRTEDIAAIEDIRKLQLKRIDRLVQALWPRAIGVNGAKADLKAVAEVRQLEAFRARIAGTEAPKKLEVSGELGIALDVGEAERLEAAWASSGGDVIDVESVEIAASEIPAGTL